jgi:hypothetical protein
MAMDYEAFTRERPWETISFKAEVAALEILKV